MAETTENMNQDNDVAIEAHQEPEVVATKSTSKTKRVSKGELTPEYVAELRAENKQRRHEVEELNKKMAEADVQAKNALEEVRKMHQAAEQKMIRAELKVNANKYGLRDLEDIKLADLSAVSITEQGDVLGVEDALIALKEKKPYLFEEVSTSRGGMQPPPSQGIKNQKARVLASTPAEYAKEEREFLNNLARGTY